MQTALQLQTSEQKPLQDPISNLNFYLQLHIPCTFHWDPLGQPVKITSDNTQRWQHRTGGSLSPTSRTLHKMTNSGFTFH